MQTTFSQTYHPADSATVIRIINNMLALKNKDVKKQDSLIQEAINFSQRLKRNDYLVKFYHLWSALKLQQNEFLLATDLGQKAVHAGKQASLEKDISFRDAVTQLAMCYSYINKQDSCISWVIYGKDLARVAKDDFNYNILQTLEAINCIGIRPDEEVEGLFDSAVVLARQTSNPHDDMMAGYNKAAFLQIAGKKDWVRSIEALTSLQNIIDHPGFLTNKTKPYHRVPFWFRGARASLYRELSRLYFQLSDLGDACYYQEEIVKEYHRNGNYTYMPYVWCDLAEYETFRNDEAKVKHIYDSSKLLIRQHYKKAEINFPSFYYAGGWLAEQKNEYENAIGLYQKAITAATPVFHVASLALFRTYNKAGQGVKADSLLKDINEKLKTDYVFFYKVLFKKELAGYYQLNGNEKLATQSLLEYYRLKDSMTTAARYYMVNEVETRFKTREREKELGVANKENLIQQKELQQKKWANIFLIGGIVLLLGLLTALYRFYKSKKQQAVLLQQKNQQIETLIRELHHRVKNNLQVVSSLMSLQSNRMDDDKAKQALEEGKTRVDAMAMIHQKLYMDNELAAVDIADYLKTLSLSLANSFGFDNTNVKTTVELPDKSMDIDRAIPIGLIVNELVTNAFKHAFRDIEHPLIAISLTQTEEKAIELKVADNGKGLQPAADLKKSGSFGMKLVYTLVDQLNGELSIKQHQGTIFTIDIRA
ncbi:MAG TPA: sensor histidine kinase [Chitinophagaceae bacterium]|nr:sensor histidine kinase [Chitinophagaceae bacterium]